MPRISAPLPSSGAAPSLPPLPPAASGGKADSGAGHEPVSYVLKLVDNAIYTKDAALSALSTKAMSPEQQREVRKANRSYRSTRRQIQVVMKQLRRAGFEIEVLREPGYGEGRRACYMMRLWMSEERLAQVAEEMEFDKELRPFRLPLQGWEGVKLTGEIPGGFMPFSMSRACAHPPEDDVLNIRVPLADTKTGQPGMCAHEGGGRSGVRWSAQGGASTTGTDPYYGGIFKRAADGKLFEQGEELSIMWWAVIHLTGLRVQFARGGKMRSGKLELVPEAEPHEQARTNQDRQGGSTEIRSTQMQKREAAALLPPREGLLYFDNFSPLHAEAQLAALKRGWALRFFTLQQPIAAVKAYFGQKVALYFDFVGVLERWLLWPSLVCAGLFTWQLIERLCVR